MTRANTASDRARARQRQMLEAEAVTGRTGLTQRQAQAILREHRGDTTAGSSPPAAPADPAPRPPAGPATSAPRVPPEHADHLIPTRDDIDLSGAAVRSIGRILAGVQDFKVLRGTTVTLSLTTSQEFAHILTDASLISRGSVLVVDLYEIPRTVVFDSDADDGEEDDGGD